MKVLSGSWLSLSRFRLAILDLPRPARHGETRGAYRMAVGFALLASSLAAFAQPAPAERQSAPLQWVKQLRPGVSYRQEVHLDWPLVIHSLKFRYPAEGVRFETAIAGDRVLALDGINGRERVDALARRTGAYAAVNADFFGNDGDPLGVMVSRGSLISEPYSPRAAAAWAESALLFDAPLWKAELVGPDGRTIQIDGVNRNLRPGEVVLYTPQGGRAYSKSLCHALVFEPVTAPPIGDETQLTFKHVLPDTQDVVATEGQVVLMATPARVQHVLAGLRQGSTWLLRLDITGEINWKAIREAVGGGPRLVKDGKAAIDFITERFQRSFATARHPRTALGYTAAGEVVLCVVDGRSTVSRGATLPEMAKIMLDLGCTNAINLDGGGSSTLCLAGLVINRPSDGAPRPVANALLLFLPEQTTQPVSLAISAKTTMLKPGDLTTLTLRDAAGKEIPNAEVLWACEGRSAWIDQGGTVRPLIPGTVRIRAVARGVEAFVDFEITEAREL